ncbi:Regulatory protein, LuxR [hydrothermal vent metagenome]|uniref:Regulatory protein, LuxR n=1 Tax=hydrothermal vent metagenome TaxID=652676 RepID=A0A1W1CQZ0_9ZZZZ
MKITAHNQNKIKLTIVLLLLIYIFISIGYDLVKDLYQFKNYTITYLIYELISLLVSGFSFFFIFNILEEYRKNIDNLNLNITSEQNISKKLKGDFLKVLEKQFDEWHLTKSEKEIIVLIFKGLPYKKIADIRNTKDITIRQQVSTIYKKIDIKSRNELIAFFFEDLL